MTTTTNTKTAISFVDKVNKRAKIKLEITHRNGYPEFTSSGEYDHSSGQCLDHIQPRTDEQKQLLELCERYHLNDMNAGTRKQRAVLTKCESTDYDQRKTFLRAHDINGNPLTFIKVEQIDAAIMQHSIKLVQLNEFLHKAEEFKTEYKKAKSGWNRSKSIDVIKTMASNSGHGSFIYNKVTEKYTPDECRFYKEFRRDIPAKYRRRLDAAIKETTEARDNELDLLTKVQLQTALYDIHPTTGKAYEYGTGWIKDDLPNNLWEQVLNLCQAIEEQEQERTEDSPKVVDINELEENDPTIKLIEDAQEDEGAAALAYHLELTVEELEEITTEPHGYGSCLYDAQGVNYYCGTEKEINEAVTEYITDTVWAFNPSFLSNETGIPTGAFEAMQEQCEDSNDAILKIIESTCGLESFVEAAEDSDGYAHFLNSWDGQGQEVTYNDTKYFICRG